MPQNRRLPLLRAALLLALAFAPAASGLTVRPLTLDELLSQSSRVLKGTITSRTYAAHNGTLSTLYVLTVEEDLAGTLPKGAHVVFRVPGGVMNGTALVVPGTPSFAAGERVVLLLRPGGGHHNIVGHFLGAYQVRPAADGHEMLIRKSPRGALIVPKQPAAVRPASIEPTDWEISGTDIGADALIRGPAGGGTKPPPEIEAGAPDFTDLRDMRAYITEHRHLMLPDNDAEKDDADIAARPPGKPKETPGAGADVEADKSPEAAARVDGRRSPRIPLVSLFLFMSGAALLAAGFTLHSRSSPTAKSSALIISAAFLLSGIASGYVQISAGGHPAQWWSSDLPLQWYMNADTTDDCQFELDAVTSSFQTWEDVPTSEIAFDFAGAPPYEDDRYDGRNILYWTQTDPNGYFDAATLALALYWVNLSNGHMLDADIIFNDRDYNWKTRAEGGPGYVVECVATHEIGHVIGLGHTGIPEATMYPYYHDGCDTLHQDDIDGATAIYPDTTPPPAPVITTNGGEDFDTTESALILDGSASGDTWTILVNGSTNGVAPFTFGDTAWQFSTELTQPDTTYTFEVVAEDATGNASAPAVIRVTFRTGWPVITTFVLSDLSSGSTTRTNWPYVGVNIRTSGSPISRYLLTESAVWEPTAQEMLDFGYPDPYKATTLSNVQGLHTVYTWVMDDQQRITGAEAQITLDSVHPILEGAAPASKRAAILEFSEPVLGALDPAVYTVSPGDWQIIQVRQLSEDRTCIVFEDGIPEGTYTLSIAEGAISDRTGDNPLFIPPGATTFSLVEEWTSASAFMLDHTHTLVIFSRAVSGATDSDDYRVAGAGFSGGGLTPSMVEMLSESVYKLTHDDLYQHLLSLGYGPSDFPITVPLSIRNVTDLGGFSIEYNYPGAAPACHLTDLEVEETPSGDPNPPQITGFTLSAFTSGSSDNTESRLVRVDAPADDAETAVIRWYLTETAGIPAQSTIMNLGLGRPSLDFILNVGAGGHTVYLHCMDAAGNIVSAQYDISLVSNDPPSVSISVSPLQEDVPPAAVVLSDASGSADPEGGPIHSVTNFGNDTPWVEGGPAEGWYDWMGSYDVTVYVKDIWGAIGSASETVQIDLDTTPPSISVNSFTLHGRVDTPAVTVVNIDGVDYPLSGGSFDVVLDFGVALHTYQIAVDDGVFPPVSVQLRGEKQ